MNLLLACFYKDFRIALSYKLQFIIKIFSPIFLILIFFFISLFFQEANDMSGDENQIFKYMLSGIIFTDLTFLVISSFPNMISEYRQQGILEDIFTIRKNLIFIVLGSYLMPLFIFFLKLIIYFLVGILLFDINIFENISFHSLILFLSFYVLSLVGISMIIASYSFIVIKGNPVQSIFFAISSIISGAFFPVSYLPNEINLFSNLLPLYHFLEIIRYSDSQESLLIGSGLFLILLSIIYLSMGYLILRKAIIKAKKDGLLIYF